MISAPKLSKACVPCHKRKLKCNASTAGLPCSRCVENRHTSSCVLARRRPRSRKLKHGGGDISTTTVDPIRHFSSNANVPSIARHSDYAQTQTATSGSRLNSGRTWSDQNQVSDLHQEPSIPERQAHLQVCIEIANGHGLPPTDRMLQASSPGRDIIEYHNSVNFMTILGDLVGNHRARRLTRIIINDTPSSPARDSEECFPGVQKRECAGLDSTDVNYLLMKGAFNLPPKLICDKLLQWYFEAGYPYMPVLDRIEFVQNYESGHHSSFLMQAILANTVPHAPMDLLLAAGFPDRLTAQRTFYSNAKLLHDFGCEKSQMRLLQGSIILGTAVLSYSSDRDIHYWLHNAVRIATRMGLHKSDIADEMDHATLRLCRRIWWVIYTRDAMFSIIGVKNVRLLNINDCDTRPLTEYDFEERNVPDDCKHILSPVTQVHKHYLIENCKLANIGAQFLSIFQQSRPLCLNPCEQDWAQAISSWRFSLPNEMQIEKNHQWSKSNHWVLLCMAISYRLECIFYRTLRIRYRGKDDATYQRAGERLFSAMFELDTIIGRVMMHDLVHLCTLTLINCATTVLALHIEVALDPSTSQIQKLMAQTYIRSGMLVLKQAQEHWISVKWTLRLFEWVIAQKNILPGEYTTENWGCQQHELMADPPSNDSTLGMAADSDAALLDVLPKDVMRDSSASDWFQDLLGFNFFENLELPAS